MRNHMLSLIETQFKLSPGDKRILLKNIKELDRAERRRYFEEIKPREKEFRTYVRGLLSSAGEEEKGNLKKAVITSLLERGGDPTIIDGLLMDTLGRLEIYKELREQAEQQGVKLKALVNFGGMGMVIILFGILTAIILYVIYH